MNEKSRRGIPIWSAACIVVVVLALALVFVKGAVNSAYEDATQKITEQKEQVVNGEIPCPFCGQEYNKE